MKVLCKLERKWRKLETGCCLGTVQRPHTDNCTPHSTAQFYSNSANARLHSLRHRCSNAAQANLLSKLQPKMFIKQKNQQKKLFQ